MERREEARVLSEFLSGLSLAQKRPISMLLFPPLGFLITDIKKIETKTILWFKSLEVGFSIIFCRKNFN